MHEHAHPKRMTQWDGSFNAYELPTVFMTRKF